MNYFVKPGILYISTCRRILIHIYRTTFENNVRKYSVTTWCILLKLSTRLPNHHSYVINQVTQLYPVFNANDGPFWILVNSFSAELFKVDCPMFKIGRLYFSFKTSLDYLITKRQTMLISGETARYELTHLNQYCL